MQTTGTYAKLDVEPVFVFRQAACSPGKYSIFISLLHSAYITFQKVSFWVPLHCSLSASTCDANSLKTISAALRIASYQRSVSDS